MSVKRTKYLSKAALNRFFSIRFNEYRQYFQIFAQDGYDAYYFAGFCRGEQGLDLAKKLVADLTAFGYVAELSQDKGARGEYVVLVTDHNPELAPAFVTSKGFWDHLIAQGAAK